MNKLIDDEMEKIGEVTHYFTKISVAVIELTGSVSVGNRIAIQGSTTDFEQKIDSMQIEHQNVKTANAGQSIGMQVAERVRPGDYVFKIVE